MITQIELMSLFDYDTPTGILTRKAPTKGYGSNRPITRHNDSGYLVTTINAKTYRVHHLIWLWFHGEMPGLLDHINRVKDDNRIENLRQCTQFQNTGNSSPRRHKYKGVTFCKQTQKWRAQIMVDYKNKPLGRFTTIEEAALAYNNAALVCFGEFAYINEVSNDDS